MFSAFKKFPLFLCFSHISVTRTKLVFLTKKAEDILWILFDAAYLPTLAPLPYNLPTPYLDVNFQDSRSKFVNKQCRVGQWSCSSQAKKRKGQRPTQG